MMTQPSRCSHAATSCRCSVFERSLTSSFHSNLDAEVLRMVTCQGFGRAGGFIDMLKKRTDRWFFSKASRAFTFLEFLMAVTGSFFWTCRPDDQQTSKPHPRPPIGRGNPMANNIVFTKSEMKKPRLHH